MPSSDFLYAGLAKVGNLFAERMKQKIDDVNAPKVIKQHIFVESPVVSETRSSIDIVIDTSEKGAPMAGAYEYGAQPYTIIPGEGKNPVMSFGRDKWPQYQPPPPAPNVFRFLQVSHPEIVARPYIRPTIIETAPEVRQILGQEFKAYLLSDMQKIVVIK